MATEAHASLRDLKFYYLGYYIHTCPKMRYKAQFPPTQVSVVACRTRLLVVLVG